ncbi:MAG: DNA repair protein RadC [Firmicutes bacterium]|nr:DNA repair protein RadC [Bacillota bacterium]
MPVYEIPVIKLSVVKDSNFHSKTKKINTPIDAAKVIQDYLRGADREHFITLALDTKNRIVNIHTVSIGTLNSSLVHPREVFKSAIITNAASIIIAHNHPSGECYPSAEDLEITRRLIDAGSLLGIPVLDSIIVSDDSYLVNQRRKPCGFYKTKLTGRRI